MGKGTVLLQPTLGRAPASYPPQESAPKMLASNTVEEPVAAAAPSANNDRYYEPDTPARVPMGMWLMDRLINGTIGSLTVDLKRPRVPRFGSRTSLFTYNSNQQPEAPLMAGQRPAYNYRTRGRLPRQALEQRQQFVDYGSLQQFAFNNSGARVKAMRHVRFGPEFTYKKYGHEITAPQFDFGVGGDFEFDTAQFKPLLRLKFRDLATLQMLPYPAIRLQRRMSLGTSGFGVRMAYECPLESLSSFYAPPARLMLTLDDMVNSGVRITQSGLEFHANKWLMGGNARIKAAGILRLPNELPIDESEMFIGFEAKRLGFKSRW